MNTVAIPSQSNDPLIGNDADPRLLFFKRLQTVTNKIHATRNIDEIMLDLSLEMCQLFDCDRLTLYVADKDQTSITSKVKTGLHAFKDLTLPVSDRSIAGYVALTKTILNVRDVYDTTELQSHTPTLQFQRGVDQKTGYRTKQVLTAPLLEAQTGELLGVVQLINHLKGTPFSTFAEEGLKELCTTLAIAFAQRRKRVAFSRSKYDFLMANAILTQEEFTNAARTARESGTHIEQTLIDTFKVKPVLIGQALSKFFNVPYDPYQPDRIKPLDLLKNLKRQFVEQHQWLPIEESKEGLVVLALDPEQVKNERVINTIFPKATLTYRVTTHHEFQQTVDAFFGTPGDSASVDELLSDMEGIDEEGGDIHEAELSAAAENELVKLVNKIITDAYRQGASDIHIEPRPGKDKTLIRFRKDGSLEPYIEIPANYRHAILARIKIMCDLDISEHRKPQDGKIKFKKFAPLDIELRVATIPSAGGVEDVVMRILAAGEPIPLDKLGVLPHNLERLKQVVSKPYGLFFVCGPTGSGKTTTLHSVLHHLNTPDTKIWTAEDPVEITQKGLRQVQVNRKAGLDFATVMRAFLRADPDVIMVGEMRDKETVSIGLEASLTGHLVFATLHTNSAPESIVRLLDMGMDPFNFADALLGILAQRLAKRLCTHCKQPYHPGQEEVRTMLGEYCEDLARTPPFAQDAQAAQQGILKRWLATYGDEQGRFTLYRAGECEHCNKGYKGRVGLHELMVGTDRVKQLVLEHARVAQLLSAALEDGMLTLKMDGIEKVLAGYTDMKQVRMVCIK